MRAIHPGEGRDPALVSKHLASIGIDSSTINISRGGTVGPGFRRGDEQEEVTVG